MINGPKSDIAQFMTPLADEIQTALLDSDYPGIAELWEQYDLAMLELKEIAPVLELMRHHDKTWHELDEVRWLAGLVEEVGELAASMMDKHDDPIAWEMMQIASIALNYLRLYSTHDAMQCILDQKQAE
jgi:hypothetical protein